MKGKVDKKKEENKVVMMNEIREVDGSMINIGK